MYEYEVFQGKQEDDGAGLRRLGHARRAATLRLWVAEPSRADGSRRYYAGIRILDLRVRKVQLLFERSKGSFVGQRRGRQQKGAAFHTLAVECELKVLHAIRVTFTFDHIIQLRGMSLMFYPYSSRRTSTRFCQDVGLKPRDACGREPLHL